jgi:hypothetical protein
VRRFLLAIFAWIAKNAVALRSIDPRDDDFADLAPLRQFIGSARFVLLGEFSSNIADVYAKYRLVRFLHEEMGFDVIASKLPFFDAEEIDCALDGKASVRYDLGQESDSVFGYSPGRGMTGFPSERIIAGNTIHGNPKYAGAPIELPGSSPSYTIDILRYARATRATGHPLHVAGVGGGCRRLPLKRLREAIVPVHRSYRSGSCSARRPRGNRKDGGLAKPHFVPVMVENGASWLSCH